MNSDSVFSNEPNHPDIGYDPPEEFRKNAPSLNGTQSFVSRILFPNHEVFFGTAIDVSHRAVIVYMFDNQDNRELLRKICTDKKVSHRILVQHMSGPNSSTAMSAHPH